MNAVAWTTRLTAWLGSLLNGLEQNRHYRWPPRLLHRHEYAVPPALFFGGVTWDALTLQRIDALLENLILGVSLLLLGGFGVLDALSRNDRPLDRPLQKLATWTRGGHSVSLPTVLRTMGVGVFLTSGFVSAGLVVGLLLYLDRHNVFEEAGSFRSAVVGGLLDLVVLFYVNHWIPPCRWR